MSRLYVLIFLAVMSLVICGCGGNNAAAEADVGDAVNLAATAVVGAKENNAASVAEQDVEEGKTMKVKITVNGRELMAALEDNATTRALVEQMPTTLPMMDLYGREMCHRYGAYALPTDKLQANRYEVGDIAYWPPGGSLVILYRQNGERFERQHLGHIDAGVEVFNGIGDVDVTFVLAE